MALARDWLLAQAPLMPDAKLRQLDAATVLEMATAISSEIVFERLLERLMTLAIEHAGSTRGLVLGPTSTGLVIEAEARPGTAVRIERRPIEPSDASKPILDQVLRGSEAVIGVHGGRAILCMPI
ncbi:MAG TPA: hypothetical protein VGC41_07885, partial [Kofleriaceae bacterium]